MIKGKKVLITGGTGQIAGPIVEDMVKDNEVWCAARFSDPARKAQLEDLGVKTVLWEMKTGDHAMLPEDFTHVVHSAIDPVGGLEHHNEGIAKNAESTALLMQHCAGAEAFLYVASFCVYRPDPEHPNHAYAESDALGGMASYDPGYPVAKIATEGAVRSACRMLNLPTTIARMNVGYSWTGHGGLPVMAYHMMSQGQPIPVPIGYDDSCSPIAGEDIARQAHLLLEAATVPATLVNWAGDDAVSTRAMVEYVADLTGQKATFVESPVSFDTFVSDNTRREQLIGKCEVSWRDGIRDTLERMGILQPA